ncbi:hypothetical protein DCC39_13290 [Pueribacillus theae]|uniref:Uncharacterized protein n=1 Tax=Pueribacillus theae TaxID=2171751 RepID=A0A2U1JWS0_9BACI|nr:hypothetical protein DCC39_13290 [Pueribacillus theae]
MNNNSNEGYTLFRPVGIKIEYPLVDLRNKQVTGTVSYNDKIYMTVIVDLNFESVEVEGSVEELKEISMNEESHIRMFKTEAKFFVENNISNPKEYFEQFK